MARGLCFQSLCAVIAVLVVAPVRSDQDDNLLHVESLVLSIAWSLIAAKLNQTIQEIEQRLQTLENQQLPKLDGQLQLMSNFEDKYGDNWNFTTETKGIRANVREIENLNDTVTFHHRFNDLRRVQQVMTFFLAFDLFKTPSLREDLDKMPDSKYLFQTTFPIRLVDGIHDDHEGRVEIEVGNMVGTICNHLVNITIAKVVCGQLGLTWHNRGPSDQLLGWGSTYNNKKTGGPVMLDQVSCRGDENHVLLCPSHKLITHENFCVVRRVDLGVSCQ